MQKGLHGWEDENAPLQAPEDSSHSHKLNFYMGIVLVVLMVVSVVALVCCCYRLEWRLRLQARSAAQRARRAEGILGRDAGSREMSADLEKKVTKQETNLSVIMPGDSIPSFLARAKPHGSVPGADFTGLSAIGGKDEPEVLR